MSYYFDKNTYPEIRKSTDPDELWDWWVEKVLQEQDKFSFKDKITRFFRK